MNLNTLFVASNLDFTNISSLIIRVFIGICFIIHGMGKLGLVGPGNMAGFEGWLKSLNVPFPGHQARAAMMCEIVGGTLITIGIFTRLGILMCFFVMVIAATIGHKGGGYLITNNPPGNEYTLNLAAILVALFLLGPGYYSVDAFLFS